MASMVLTTSPNAQHRSGRNRHRTLSNHPRFPYLYLRAFPLRPSAMTDSADQDAPLVEQRENRHLKDTITALREQMEALRADHGEEIQAATAFADAEVRQLQETVSALRARLEQFAESAQEESYAAQRQARGEMEQYQDTIRELRHRLEQRGGGGG